MTIQTLNFSPNSAYVIAVATTTSNTALTQPPAVAGSAGNAGGYTSVVIYNSGAKVMYFSFGNTAQTATASSLFQVAPGATMTFDLPSPCTNVGAILESGTTANAYLMLGTGT